MDWNLILKLGWYYMRIIWNYIVYIIGSILTGIFVWVISMYRGWKRYTKELKLSHSIELIKDFQCPEVTFNHFLKDGLKLEVKPYPNELIEHLKDDTYKDKKAKEKRDSSLIEIIERRDFYINKLHNEELKAFYDNLQDDIITCIEKRNFIKHDNSRSSVGQINFFNKETIELDIIRVIQNNYYALESLKFKINLHDNFNDLALQNNSNPWVISDNEHKKELEDVENELTTIFDEAINKKFYLFLWYYHEITEFQTLINEKLKKIIDEMMTGNPLKSKCTKCPKGCSFGQYILYRIDKSLQ